MNLVKKMNSIVNMPWNWMLGSMVVAGGFMIGHEVHKSPETNYPIPKVYVPAESVPFEETPLHRWMNGDGDNDYDYMNERVLSPPVIELPEGCESYEEKPQRLPVPAIPFPRENIDELRQVPGSMAEVPKYI